MNKVIYAAFIAYLLAVAAAFLYPPATMNRTLGRPDPCRTMYRLELRPKGCESYPSDLGLLPAPMTEVILWKRQSLILIALTALFATACFVIRRSNKNGERPLI